MMFFFVFLYHCCCFLCSEKGCGLQSSHNAASLSFLRKNINNGNRDNHDDKNLEDFINELMRLTKKNLSQVENAVNN